MLNGITKKCTKYTKKLCVHTSKKGEILSELFLFFAFLFLFDFDTCWQNYLLFKN